MGKVINGRTIRPVMNWYWRDGNVAAILYDIKTGFTEV